MGNTLSLLSSLFSLLSSLCETAKSTEDVREREGVVSRDKERRGSPHAAPHEGNNFRCKKMRGEREKAEGGGKKEKEEREREEKK